MRLVGTSGWYYGEWQERGFYPADLPQRQFLSCYAEQFNAVEVNATFYRSLKPSTGKEWRRKTPDGFRFILKAPKAVTHQKSPKPERAEALQALVEALEEKFGGVLIQLPPSRQLDREWLTGILGLFEGVSPIAVEFRHPSWEAAFDDLRSEGVVVVTAHWHDARNYFPPEPPAAYLRLHGTVGFAVGQYEPDTLAAIAQEVSAGRGFERVWAFFNNDVECAAIYDARVMALQLR